MVPSALQCFIECQGTVKCHPEKVLMGPRKCPLGWRVSVCAGAKTSLY